MDALTDCTATFTRNIRTLTMSKSGLGSADSLVMSSPSGVWCGSTCTASFDVGTAVALTASPAPGYAFVEWQGTGCGWTVLLDEARSCTAVFEEAPPPPGCDPEARAACCGDGERW
ncbi:MAG: hypothetical protein M0Z51_14515, partial [Propionibacterium sp.]|nr:hypothetical protein [Propionibacterium sp.]